MKDHVLCNNSWKESSWWHKCHSKIFNSKDKPLKWVYCTNMIGLLKRYKGEAITNDVLKFRKIIEIVTNCQWIVYSYTKSA